MRPSPRPMLRVLAATAMTMSLALAPGTRAQDPSPESALGSFCALITADEASAALGVPVAPSGGSAFDCDWAADEATGDYTRLIVRAESGTIADTKAANPGGADVDISGSPAYYYSPDAYTRQLWMEAGGRFLGFQLIDYHTDDATLDVQPVLTALATIAAGRIGSMSIPVLGDQALEDLFPDEIGGLAVDVLSLSGQQLLANVSGAEAQATVQGITDALTLLGKTIDDVGFGYATISDSGGGALIVALQVRGADATTLVPLVMPLFVSGFLGSFSDAQETPTQVAGRDVVMVTDGPPSATGLTAYVYPKDDLVWLVAISGLSVPIEEVLGALP